MSKPQQEVGNHYSVVKGVLYRSGNTTCFFKQNKTFHNKFSKTKSIKH